ncbi:unnamed protein product [Rotaria sp. Silwood1]|nr:unnamed protein product [Rotaria sp. Silwood1]CAF1381725.1 unnamed protein product [Rotaria sp. Silwood1]
MSLVEELELNSADAAEPSIIEPTEDFNEIEPTTEEFSTLEHIADKIPLGAWLIVVCELCERFAFYGLSGLFQNYIQFPLPTGNDTQPGALDRGQQTATALTNFFRFFAYLTPILGAILADQFWGKYKTIVVSCVVYMIGLVVILLTSIPPAIQKGVAFPGLIVAMIIIGFGTGGVKSNVSPLMAEQYSRKKAIITVINGQKKIIDPSVTTQSMFNWFYWAINIGALSLIVTTNVEKYHSFWLAFLIPTVAFVGAIVVLVIGRDRYVQIPPSGSLLVRAGGVTVTAIRMRWKLGKQSDRPDLLDYAKKLPGSIDHNEEQTAIELRDNQFIDDLKKAIRACRVFLFYPFYWICYNQFGSNLVSQAAQMNVGPLPNDILQNIDPIVIVIFIPIFDKFIYPGLRRCKISFTAIPRISAGFFCVSIGMAWSAIVQHLIYITGPNFDYVPEPDKTAAFSLVILSRIDSSIPSMKALILAPTSKLAIQISSAIEKMAQFYYILKLLMLYINITISIVFGQFLTESIGIGTQGTVKGWSCLQHGIDLSQVRICCVDEADVIMLTYGFEKVCVHLVRSANPSVCRMILFPAKYFDEVNVFAREIVKDQIVLRLKDEKQTLHNITQFFIRCYDQQQNI